MQPAWPRPIAAKKGQLLLRVLASSTAYGDAHMMSGRMSIVLNYPFPYIPAMDVCGIGPGVTSGRG